MQRLFWRVLLLAAISIQIQIQAEEDHHTSDDLDFWHPLITESPFPEREFDFSYQHTANRDHTHDDTWNIGTEWAFTRNFSLELHAPVLLNSRQDQPRIESLDFGFKYASFAFEKKGLLIATGIEFELPLDKPLDEERRTFGISPFGGVGYKHDRLEVISFLRPTVEFQGKSEFSLGYDLSVLYFLHRRVALITELNGRTILSGTESGVTKLTVSPGLKFQPFDSSHNVEFGMNATLPASSKRDQNWGAGFSMIVHF